MNVERFELHLCRGNAITVCAFEHKKKKPSLTFDTGDGYPRYMLQAFNILVLQSTGGASDHVYVFVFRNEKPRLAWKTATKALVQATQSSHSITVTVPATKYPDQGGDVPAASPPMEKTFGLESH